MKDKWQNVPGRFDLELWTDQGHIVDDDDRPVSPEVNEILLRHARASRDWSPDDMELDVSIAFESTGYYDSGVTYGTPERCYPPEGDDERTVTQVTLLIHRGQREPPIVLPDREAREIFDEYFEEIQKTELH